MRNFNYRSACFLSTVQDSESKVITVGQEKDVGGSLKIFNTASQDFEKPELIFNDYIESDANCSPLRLNDICKIVSNKNMVENIAVSTSRGAIKVLGMPPKLRDSKEYTHQHLVTHYGDALHVKAAEDGFYAFSAGSDGIIFVYKVIEVEQSDRKKPGMQANDVSVSLPATGNRGSEKIGSEEETKGEHKVIQASMKGIQIQEEMARIVLVCKTRMENWRKKQEDLKTEMEDESNKVDSSLRQEKFLYEKRINQMEREKTD